MPWLSRQPSRQNSGSEPALNGGSSPSMQPNSTVQMGAVGEMMPVSFIPAQIDGMCSTTPPHMVQAPATLMRDRAIVMLRNLHCLPSMLAALCTKAMMREYLADPMACRDLVLQCCLGCLQIGGLMVLPLAMLLLPGVASMCVVAVCWAVMAVLTWPLNEGARVSRVVPEGMSARESEEVAEECWLYINSMMTSHHAHLAHLHRLATTFRRPITGVHNPTHGPLIDALAALLSPFLPSSTTQPLTAQLRLALLSPQISKVVLLAHGTGTLPMATSLDALHADLPLVCVSKLEIYTFGACTSYLNNPLLVLDALSQRDVAVSMASPQPSQGQGERSRSKSPLPQWTRPDGSIASPVKVTLKSLGHRVEDMERVISHVEHYALAGDFIARCGVLDAVRKGTARFAGRVFVLGGQAEDEMDMRREIRRDSGMMRLLSRMGMPSPTGDMDMPSVSEGRGMGGKGMNTCGSFGEYMDALFPLSKSLPSALDTCPSIAHDTACRREFIAQSTSAPLILASQKTSFSLGLGIAIPNPTSSSSSSTSASLSPSDNAPRSRKEKRSSWGTTACLGVDGVGRARQCAREARGKTARQLSRLWMFEGGRVPTGMGVPLFNGVGHQDGKEMAKNGVGMGEMSPLGGSAA